MAKAKKVRMMPKETDEAHYNNSISPVLVRIRTSRGLRQLDFANAAGFSQQLVFKLESGGFKDLPLEFCQQLAKKMMLTIQEKDDLKQALIQFVEKDFKATCKMINESF